MKTKYLTLNKIAKSKNFGDFNDSKFRAHIGEDAPKLEPTKLGQYRLMMGLRNKYGANYRNIPGISEALKDFDLEVRYHKIMKKLKG